jgi:SUR7/PalI family
LGGVLNTLESDAQHALGIHDFYRYGLWGFCEGYNNTVVSCTNPKPGNATNPIASINAEFTHGLHAPLPSNVEKDIHRLQSASLFIFSSWITGVVAGFAAALFGIFPGCRSKLTSLLIGTFALVFLRLSLSDSLLGILRVHFDWRCALSSSVRVITRRHEHCRLRHPQYAYLSWCTDVCICVGKLRCEYPRLAVLGRMLLFRISSKQID